MELPSEPGRGREAESPGEIPKTGWIDIFTRVSRGLSQQNESVLAAGIAFFAFISVPAILTSFVSIYGMVANPSQVEQQMGSLQGVVPSEALPLIMGQLKNVTSQSGGSLTLALIVSIGIAFYGASSSLKALMSSLNQIYQEQEKRGFLKYNAMAIGLTLGGAVFASISIVLVALVSALISHLSLPPFLKTLITVLRWPLLAAFMVLSLAVIYRYGPSRENPKWKWVSWGAVIATGIWLAASGLFSWYAGSFGNYDKTYGSLSAIVVLLMWFYISGYAILLGAKINAEMEHQTDQDTTTGRPLPMGTRGARMSDTRGEAA